MELDSRPAIIPRARGLRHRKDYGLREDSLRVRFLVVLLFKNDGHICVDRWVTI